MDRLCSLPSLKAREGGGTHPRLIHPHGHDVEINKTENNSMQMERFSLTPFFIPLQSSLFGWNGVSSVPPPEMLTGPYPTPRGASRMAAEPSPGQEAPIVWLAPLQH